MVGTHRSANAFASGASVGVLMIWTPSAADVVEGTGELAIAAERLAR